MSSIVGLIHRHVLYHLKGNHISIRLICDMCVFISQIKFYVDKYFIASSWAQLLQ